MKTQEVALKNQKEINIVMEEDAKVMDEVVVTGIFERKKKVLPGRPLRLRVKKSKN